jgi:hypothetical protein
MTVNELTTVSMPGQKSFWSRPEGRVGAGFAVVLGVALLAGVYRLLPLAANFISRAADLTAQIWRLLALGVPLVLVIMLLLNPKFHLLVSYMFKSVMWHLTNAFVDLDPVAIIRGYLSTLQKYIEDMSKQMSILNGHIQKLTEKISKYKEDRDKYLGQVQAGSKDMDKYRGQVLVAGKQVDRLEATERELEALRQKLQNAYEVLTRVREISQIKYADMNNAVNVEIDKRDAYKAVGGVLRSAMKILKGGEGKELYDMSMEKLVNDYTLEMGHLEDFLQETQTMFVSLDLEDEASAQRTLARIAQWEKESEGKTMMLEHKAEPVVMAYGGPKGSATDAMLEKILASKK